MTAEEGKVISEEVKCWLKTARKDGHRAHFVHLSILTKARNNLESGAHFQSYVCKACSFLTLSRSPINRICLTSAVSNVLKCFVKAALRSTTFFSVFVNPAQERSRNLEGRQRYAQHEEYQEPPPFARGQHQTDEKAIGYNPKIGVKVLWEPVW